MYNEDKAFLGLLALAVLAILVMLTLSGFTTNFDDSRIHKVDLISYSLVKVSYTTISDPANVQTFLCDEPICALARAGDFVNLNCPDYLGNCDVTRHAIKPLTVLSPVEEVE